MLLALHVILYGFLAGAGVVLSVVVAVALVTVNDASRLNG